MSRATAIAQHVFPRNHLGADVSPKVAVFLIQRPYSAGRTLLAATPVYGNAGLPSPRLAPWLEGKRTHIPPSRPGRYQAGTAAGLKIPEVRYTADEKRGSSPRPYSGRGACENGPMEG